MQYTIVMTRRLQECSQDVAQRNIPVIQKEHNVQFTIAQLIEQLSKEFELD